MPEMAIKKGYIFVQESFRRFQSARVERAVRFAMDTGRGDWNAHVAFEFVNSHFWTLLMFEACESASVPADAETSMDARIQLATCVLLPAMLFCDDHNPRFSPTALFNIINLLNLSTSMSPRFSIFCDIVRKINLWFASAAVQIAITDGLKAQQQQ